MKDFIVIPTYNERGNIAVLIPKVFAIAPDASVVVVDDDSPDGTADEVRRLMESHPRLELYAHNQKAGFARAYIDAFRMLLERESDIDSIIMMDADLSHDPVYLPTFRDLLRRADLVIGSRYIAGGGLVGWEWWRRFLSGGGNEYLRAVSGIRIKDITGGFNGIRAEALRKILLSPDEARGYAFQFVLKYKLVESGATFVETPIVFRNRLEGESKLTHHIIREALITPWKIRHTRKP